jgi:pimeloyl-ACP methyl ester carboxylesterase
VEIRDESGRRGGGGDCDRAVLGVDRGVHGRGLQEVALPRTRRATLGSRLARAGFFAAAVLVGGCAYLSEKQGELIFRPTQQTFWGYNPDAARGYQDHWVRVGEGQQLHGWYLESPDPRAPVLLYLHGARWNLTGSATRIERWRRLGFSVLAVDYRGFGRSANVAPTEAYAYEDAEAAWDYLAKLAPGKPRFIVGHSLGGAIATELARRHPEASGLVLEATFTSVQDMVEQSAWGFLPVGLILTQKFDTLSKLPEVKMPVLIAHGTRDSIVPFAMGERLYQAAPSPKRFIRVEGAGHHNLSGAGFDEYRAAIAELFKRPG